MVLFQLPQKWLAMSSSANDCLPHAQIRLGEVEVSRMVEFSATCSLINNDRLRLEFSKETLLLFSCQDIFMHYRIGHKVPWHSKVSAVMHLKRRPSDIQGRQLISIKPFRCYALALWAPPFACLLETCFMGQSSTNTATSGSYCKRGLFITLMVDFSKYLKWTHSNIICRLETKLLAHSLRNTMLYLIYPLLPNIHG